MGEWHEHRIIKALVADIGAFPLAQQFVAVPNVSYGFLNGWEADLLVVSKAGYMTEVEVKVSMADWKADKGKRHKFKILENPDTRTKRFYYALPQALAERWKEVEIPSYAGVLGAEESQADPSRVRFNVLREVTDRPARKLTDKEMAKLARLGTMRYWDLQRNCDLYHRNPPPPESRNGR